MIDVMAYRGPDDEGIFTDRNVGLGHRRLAIIDLSPSGRQPMTNEDSTVWLVFNGEIYNYRELVPELRDKGHRFRTTTDSEVILHAYEEWGPSCVERFNGMWAFAIWDKRKRLLFLSRDRFGVKPLYYALCSRWFAFASEIKCLTALFAELRRPNYPYLYRFLNDGTLDDGEETSFEPVKQLLPAHSLTVTDGELRLACHWRYDPETVKDRYDYRCPESTFKELLTDSVRLRLRSDVPVGTCLSGGLDSSAITALASRELGRPIKTFSCIYEDPSCDERVFIQEVSRHWNTDAILVRPDGGDLFEVLAKIVWHQDEPTAGPGLYSQWHVMRAAQGQVKVLLDGQGGDELLGGYFPYFAPYLASVVKDFLLRWQVRYLITLVRAMRAIGRRTSPRDLIRYAQQCLPPEAQRLVSRMSMLVSRLGSSHANATPSVLHPEFVESVRGREIHRTYPRVFHDDLNDVLYWQLVRQSLPALLHYEDRNSMAFSLEARTPFLDYRLVEFCLGLPYHLKIREGATKYILRMAMREDLPSTIVERRDKKGYATPMGRWFLDIAREQTKELLHSDEVRRRKLLNVAGVQARFEQHCRGVGDASWEIYRWITTELWFRTFID
jgi:asparagine synthase (glutamine-hydrolysing)